MNIYFLMIVLIGLVQILTLGGGKKERSNVIIISFSCLAIILVQGIRSPLVGTDLFSYLPSYEYSKYINVFKGERLFNYEVGYILYSQFFSKLNFSPQFYLVIVASTIIIPIGNIWFNNSKLPFVSVYTYIALGFFTFSFSGLRQAIAIAITFYSYKMIQKKKKIKFLIFIIIASLFHKTALVFIIAYPLYYFKIKRKDLLKVIPLMTIVLIFKSKLYSFIYFLYRGNSELEIDHTNAYTLYFIMVLIYFCSYIFYKKPDRRYSSYQNYLLVAIFVQSFASVSSTIMRAGYYYYIFITLLIPEILVRQKKGSKFLIILLTLMAFLLFYYKTNINGYLNVVPYYFFWE